MTSDRHDAAPPGTAPPGPTLAEQARALAHLGRIGALGTLSRRHPGHPFVSVMPYATDGQGRPIMLISQLAIHTQNLDADSRASLLVVQAGRDDDALALARVTLMGRAARLPGPERTAAKDVYCARHPTTTDWVDFGDFAFWRLDLTAVYFVGGFGSMDWLTAGDYEAATPDPPAGPAADEA